MIGDAKAEVAADGTFSLAALYGEYDVTVLVSGIEVYSGQVELDDELIDVEIDVDKVQLGWDDAALTIGDMPDGWQLSEGDVGIYQEPGSGLMALRLKPAERARSYMMLDRAVTGTVILEYSAYTPDTRTSLAMSMAEQLNPTGPASGLWGPFVSIRDGAELSYYVDNQAWGHGWYLLGIIDINRWNHYRIVVDVPAKSFDVYVNGVFLGTGRFRTNRTLLNQVEVATWGQWNTEWMWVRDIRVIHPKEDAESPNRLNVGGR